MDVMEKSLLEPCGEFIVGWLNRNAGRNHKVAIGLSGGKDSTVMAGLCSHVLGRENVIGLLIPNGTQADISDSRAVVNHLGIEAYEVNIGDAFNSISAQVPGFDKSEVARTNFPARLRLATIMATAQSMGATMVNTCNRSENVVGYCTLFGDDGGSFSPFGRMTTEEIIQIGDELGLPHELVHKTPVDGLQSLSDEEKLGFTYHEINELIRYSIRGEHYDAIMAKYFANKFKLKIVRLDTFDTKRPDYFDMVDYGLRIPYPEPGLTFEVPSNVNDGEYAPPTVQEYNKY